MFQRIIDAIGGSYNKKQIDEAMQLVGQIRKQQSQRSSITPKQVQEKTKILQDRIKSGETLDEILIEAYALVCVACEQLVGKAVSVKEQTIQRNMVPYDVQLVGAIVLHQGNIAEMKTGEGKTLAATLPAFLNALTGKGVHIVTVNDYLVSFQAAFMTHLYEHLGLQVGTITKTTSQGVRKEEYSKDIVYVENTELGFDYLRDNLAKTKENRVLLDRPLHYAIIDEIDSVLIDEARTPLIISQPSAQPTEKYQQYASLVEMLVPAKGKKKTAKGFLQKLREDEEAADDENQSGDYFIDSKAKTAVLSSSGIEKLEQLLNVENLYRDVGFEEIHHIENALKATGCYHKDKDYMINNGEVLIIDEHTGRVMPGRRFGQGLHQAIEAKENVQIQKESKTVATITYQNFFKLYEKLAGMTGTAATEGEEFEKIYDLQTVSIPTNKPTIRVDKVDTLYVNQHAKRQSIIEMVNFYNSMEVPILIGTSSIATSEYVSALLRKKNFKHFVLNAKYHEQEAHIIANAGKAKNIVVATNMAGRGTDIKLQEGLLDKIGKSYVTWIQRELNDNQYIAVDLFSAEEVAIFARHALENNLIDSSLYDASINHQPVTGNITDGILIEYKPINKKREKDKLYARYEIKNPNAINGTSISRDLHFGLMILGSEKHDARRIDNQLRGRAGRQGDPGVSQFILALDDEVMKKVLGNKVQMLQTLAGAMLGDEVNKTALTAKQFAGSITSAQKQMEGGHYSIRRRLFDYDNVISQHRIFVYQRRNDLLNTDIMTHEEIVLLLEKYSSEIANTIIEKYSGPASLVNNDGNNYALLKKSILEITNQELNIQDTENVNLLPKRIREIFDDQMKSIRTISEEQKQSFAETFRTVGLMIIDRYWMQHIDDMQYLRDKVSLWSYAQQDPLILYKKESYEKFINLQYVIKAAILEKMFEYGQTTTDQQEVVIAEGWSRIQATLSSITTASANVGSNQTSKKAQISLNELAKNAVHAKGVLSRDQKKRKDSIDNSKKQDDDDIDIIEV